MKTSIFEKSIIFFPLFMMVQLAMPNSLPECNGIFKGVTPSKVELDEIVKKHKEWCKDLFFSKGLIDTEKMRQDPRRANLCGAWLDNANFTGDMLYGADLSESHMYNVNLSDAVLENANLTGAWLLDANLTGADLYNANLTRAWLENANLTGAKLDSANLTKAVLENANLIRAVLNNANLTGAWLDNANLTGAWFVNANLSGAHLFAADLNRTVFEPESLPNVDKIAYAFNLSKTLFIRNPQALVKLRNAFKEAGYHDQERETTCAIEHQRTIIQFLSISEKGTSGVLPLFKGLFRFIFFDLTTKWGMAPGRAICILLVLILLFTIPYYLALSKPTEFDGIWYKWNENRIPSDIGSSKPEIIHVRGLKAFWLGLYFSLLSGFSIGWREFNVGNCIQRLQTKDYTLHATGWDRAISGTQSLISLYLVAIWVLTYFGRPFE